MFLKCPWTDPTVHFSSKRDGGGVAGGWVKDGALNVTQTFNMNSSAHIVQTYVNNIIGEFSNGLMKVIKLYN